MDRSRILRSRLLTYALPITSVLLILILLGTLPSNELAIFPPQPSGILDWLKLIQCIIGVAWVFGSYLIVGLVITSFIRKSHHRGPKFEIEELVFAGMVVSSLSYQVLGICGILTSSSVIAMPILFWLASLKFSSREIAELLSGGEQYKKYRTLFIAIILSIFFILLLKAAMPGEDVDSLAHQLQLPRAILWRGGFSSWPLLLQYNYPASSSILYLPFVVFRQIEGIQIFNLCLLGLSVVALARVSRSLYGEGAQWVSSGLLVISPVAFAIAVTGKSDSFLLFYASLSATIMTGDGLRSRRAVLLGLLAGMSIGTKFYALPLVCVLFVYLLTTTKRSSRVRVVMSFFIWAAIPGVLWYGRNFYSFHCATYPKFCPTLNFQKNGTIDADMYAEVLFSNGLQSDRRRLSPTLAERFVEVENASSAPPTSILIRDKPWALLRGGAEFGREGNELFNPLLLIAVLSFLRVDKISRRLAMAGLFIITSTTLLGTTVNRYLLSGVPFLILSVVGLIPAYLKAFAKRVPGLSQSGIMAIVGAVLLLGALIASTFYYLPSISAYWFPWHFARADLELGEKYEVGYRELVAELSRPIQPPVGKVFAIEEMRSLHIPVPFHADHDGELRGSVNWKVVLAACNGSHERIWKSFLRDGYTHVVINWNKARWDFGTEAKNKGLMLRIFFNTLLFLDHYTTAIKSNDQFDFRALKPDDGEQFQSCLNFQSEELLPPNIFEARR